MIFKGGIYNINNQDTKDFVIIVQSPDYRRIGCHRTLHIKHCHAIITLVNLDDFVSYQPA